MRVLIASGGSGGHIFPAVSLARELKKKSIEVIFVASRRRLDNNLLKDEPYRTIFLSANPMPYRFGWQIFPFLGKVIFDSLASVCILIRYRPGAVIGFGGYTAGAILISASLMNIKTIIHEQNLVPGRTNKLLDRFADKVAVSFDETKKYFRNKNIVFTGNPLREESLKYCGSSALKAFGLDEKKITILVMGGSQGARSLNNLVSKSISLLSAEKKELAQIIHIAGTNEKDAIERRYNVYGVHARVYGFIKNINEAYSACDIAVSRSGAAALFELAAFGKPMILIPYPNEHNNQRQNAMYFADKNAAIFKEERRLGERELRDIIVELIDNAGKRMKLAENARRLSSVDGAKRLADEIIKTLNPKHETLNKSKTQNPKSQT
jgi:UDP-N-acetylglucosamine--N-acetylmuramyl-(pentapeptide) pyrophosphoryl-undecaprenol N-acetylglucosamine transferase